MDSSESIASEGLNIKGCFGKWNAAKRYEIDSPRAGTDSGFLPYWERVRLTFLELGGEFIGQRYAGGRQ